MLSDMNKAILTLLIFFVPTLSQADCLNEFSKYQLKTLASPITSLSTSAGSSTIGSGISLASSASGLISSQADMTTAGALYGLAFAFEGQYYLQGAWWDLRNFHSRGQVYKIIKQAQVGIGPELQELLIDLNQRTFTGHYFSLKEFSFLIREGNRKKDFCPEERGVFTVKNLSNYLLDKVGQSDDPQDVSDINDELTDYWDSYDGLL
jgi:hypothetical protein